MLRWATGWGTLRSGGAVSRYLMEVQMPFLTDTRCKQKYSIADIPTMVCAGETGENKDTCQVRQKYIHVWFKNKGMNIRLFFHLKGWFRWSISCSTHRFRFKPRWCCFRQMVQSRYYIMGLWLWWWWCLCSYKHILPMDQRSNCQQLDFLDFSNIITIYLK